MSFELLESASTASTLPTARQRSVRLRGIECKPELAVRFEVPGCWGSAGTSLTEYE